MALVVVDLTYLWYTQGSLVSLLLAYSSLLPLAIGVAVLTLFVSRRDLQTLMFGTGIILCTLSNIVLKKILKHPRPFESLRSGYGMPSDHSQFMFFVATYGTLIVMAAERTRFTKASISLGLFITATIVAWSRLFASPFKQFALIVAGALIGMALALAWHLFIVLLVRPKLFDFLQRSSLGRRLRIRDCAHVHDIVKLEYEAVMSCPGAVSFDDLSRTSETQIEKKIK